MDDHKKPKDAPVVIEPLTVDNGERDVISTTGPLLSPKRLKKKYLFGVPMKAPLTGDEIDEDDLKDFIKSAISEFELEVRIPVAPVRITDQIDYERADDTALGAKRLTRWPLLKVESLTALLPGHHPGQETVFPTSWIEPDGDTGLVRVIARSGTEITSDINIVATPGLGGGLGPGIGPGWYVSGVKSWPNMWRITYLAGFDHDKVPDIVNHCIGVMAAYQLLSQLGPALFPFNSLSVGIDGMSQGQGNAGPQWLAQRMQELAMERDRLVQELRAHYGTNIIMSVW
jgi:hypothetical protein